MHAPTTFINECNCFILFRKTFADQQITKERIVDGKRQFDGLLRRNRHSLENNDEQYDNSKLLHGRCSLHEDSPFQLVVAF